MMRHLVVALVLMINAGVVLADVPPIPNRGGNANSAEWWSEQDAGWLGGFVGGSVGILGAVFGVTAGLGKARSIIVPAAIAMFCIGVVLLLVGTIALTTGQPYHVYFLFFIIGGVLTFVMGFNLPMLKRRYEQLELQRMQAMDS